jgi:iron-sulfur cluster assembly protein
MSVIEQTQTEEISITPAAAQAVQDLLAKRNLEGYSLRMFIQGGGCSGYQYGMALDNRVRDTDQIFSQHGVQVIVDEIHQLPQSATVDYVDEIMGSGFKINNPNAVSSCGCGSSFRTSEDGESSGGGCGGGCH